MLSCLHCRVSCHNTENKKGGEILTKKRKKKLLFECHSVFHWNVMWSRYLSSRERLENECTLSLSTYQELIVTGFIFLLVQ